MAIQENLKKILSSRFGKDVRKAIHDSIHDCYQDGKAGVTDLIARERLDVVEETKATRSELSTEIGQTKAEIDIERKRINEFTKLPEGSTAGDAELADIRVGADGKTYSNAGEAVRGQVSMLKGDLDSLEYDELSRIRSIIQSKNLVDPTKTVAGYIYNQNGDINQENKRYKTTYLLNVKSGESYVVSSFTNNIPITGRKIALVYDRNKNPIKESYMNIINVKGIVVTIPENGCYLRCSADVGETPEKGFIYLAKGNLIPEECDDFSVTFINKMYIPEIPIFSKNIQKNNSYIELIAKESLNLLNPSSLVEGYYCNHNGTIIKDDKYCYTDLISVKPGQTYSAFSGEKNSDNTARFIAYYDSNKKIVPAAGVSTPIITFTIPDKVSYMRITYFNDKATQMLVFGKVGEVNGAPYIEHKNNINISFDMIDGVIKNGKNLVDETKLIDGYIGDKNVIVQSETYKTTDYIPVKAGVTYVCSPKIRTYALYDNYKTQVYYDNTVLHDMRIITPTVDGYLRVSKWISDKYLQVEEGKAQTPYEPYREILAKDILLNDVQLKDIKNRLGTELCTNITTHLMNGKLGNLLYGKKWAVCGDSFTAQGYSPSNKLEDGKYKGKNKTYPWFIGNRTGIDIYDFSQGGRTLAYPEIPNGFTNSLTCPTADCYYQNIPEDVDYITIYLGINDGHHRTPSSSGDGEDNTGVIPLGTINDTTVYTYYGAWNVVIPWLMEHRPFAHIGIIISNGCDTVDYRTAQLEIAKKYGIPYIDLNGDERTPMMIRSQNPNISQSVKNIVDRKQAVDYDGSKTGSINKHPNDEAHEYESWFIENFLRSL